MTLREITWKEGGGKKEKQLFTKLERAPQKQQTGRNERGVPRSGWKAPSALKHFL
jgi:hypothetical protein